MGDAGATGAGPVDVVGYVSDGVAHSWCGWCRRWSWHGSIPPAGEWPFARPGQCRGDCPFAERDVLVWPVPAPPDFRLTAGDGVPGGQLRQMEKTPRKVPPPIVLARPASDDEICRAGRVAEHVGRQNGWDVRRWYARGTWATTTTQKVSELVTLEFRTGGRCELTMTWRDGKFENARNRQGRLSNTEARVVIKERPVQ